MSKNDKVFQNGDFCTNMLIIHSQLPALSLFPLSPALTKEARLRKSANWDFSPVHVMTKAGFTCQQRANTSRNEQEINEFWQGESKQSLRKERNSFPSLYCNREAVHGVASGTIRSIHCLNAACANCQLNYGYCSTPNHPVGISCYTDTLPCLPSQSIPSVAWQKTGHQARPQ